MFLICKLPTSLSEETILTKVGRGVWSKSVKLDAIAIAT